MGITDTTSRITYSGNGITTAFAFNYRVFNQSDLKVILVSALGVETVQTLTTHYTVALNSGEGGTVTMITPPPSGETLYIGKDTAMTQPNSISVGPLPNLTLEDMYDRLTMFSHQVKELTSRVPLFRRSSPSVDKVMPEPDEGFYMRWTAGGDLENSEGVIPAGGIGDGDISASAAIALSKLEALTANRGVVTDGSGEVIASASTDTEVGYLSGVTSAIQTQLNAKEASGTTATHAALTTSHGVAGDLVGTTDTQTMSAKTLTSPVLNTGVSGTAILDEDAMGSDSNTQLATQQSIKAYADTQDALAILKSTATTKGDVLAATASATVTRLGVGSNGQVLTAASGQATGLEWATPSSSTASLSVSTKTAAYTLTTADDLILGDTSGAAFTLTLPTAVGNTGKVFIIKYTDSGFANALTVDGDGTETIDGSTTTTLDTQNETLKIASDGTNWEILDRKIPSKWVNYSPGGTYSGDANATYDGYWKRAGDSILLRLECDFTGAVAALGAMTFGTPTGLTFDTAKLTTNFAVFGNFPELGSGGGFESGVACHQIKLTYDTTSTVACYFGTYTSPSVRNDDLVDHNSPATWGASDAVMVSSYQIPISGWNE